MTTPGRGSARRPGPLPGAAAGPARRVVDGLEAVGALARAGLGAPALALQRRDRPIPALRLGPAPTSPSLKRDQGRARRHGQRRRAGRRRRRPRPAPASPRPLDHRPRAEGDGPGQRPRRLRARRPRQQGQRDVRARFRSASPTRPSACASSARGMGDLKESKQAVARDDADPARRLRAADDPRPGGPAAVAAALLQHGRHQRPWPAVPALSDGPRARGRLPDGAAGQEPGASASGS